MYQSTSTLGLSTNTKIDDRTDETTSVGGGATSKSSSLQNFCEHLLLVGTTIPVMSAGWTVCVAAHLRMRQMGSLKEQG
jgi:hypothetical protein